MRYILFGGTFDPIHNGHLQIAREAADGIGDIDIVIFMPSGDPWMKFDQKVTLGYHRANMVDLALIELGIDNYIVFREEIFNPFPSYTADSVLKLKELGIDGTCFLLVGADVISNFHEWHNVHQLLEMVQVIVAQRSGFLVPELDTSLPRSKFTFIENTPSPISSTDIRQRVMMGKSIKGLVPESVEQYILEKGLYRNDS